MALETASYVANLVVTNPDGDDTVAAGDDHIRLLKAVLKRQFPLADSAWSISAAQVMYLGDLSASVQLQLNQLRDGSATANNAIYANSAGFAAVAANALSLGGVVATDFARLSQTNVFTGGILAIQNNAPQLVCIENGAAVDNGRWRQLIDGEQLRLQVANDAASVHTTYFSVDRTGTTVDGVQISATTITLNGNVVGTISNAATADTATNATNASFASQAIFANTCTSASSAALLSGLSGDTAATASTVALRNSSGYLFSVYYNQSSAGSEAISVGQVFAEANGDGYHRKVTPALLGTYMDARNITGKSGTAKTLASGTGPPSLSGSTNGDVFYYY